MENVENTEKLKSQECLVVFNIKGLSVSFQILTAFIFHKLSCNYIVHKLFVPWILKNHMYILQNTEM